jgi:hypothetical protein
MARNIELSPPRTPPRCSYCRAASVVWFRYQGHLSACVIRRQPTVTAGACAEHEGCVNWKSLLDFHPDAKLRRSA